MKKDIHPTYRDIIFWDISSNAKFLTRSTINSAETMEWEDGKTYPVAKVEVSSASHAFYTGKKTFSAKKGRVAKFHQKYKKFYEAKK